MLSRIFWIGLAGVAFLGGLWFQDGGHFGLSFGDESSPRVERLVDSKVDRIVDRVTDDATRRIEVESSDGRPVELDPALKRALVAAVGEEVRAEAALALLEFRDSPKAALDAARARRDQAKATLKALETRVNRAADQDRSADRDAIRDQVREEIRDSLRG